MVSEKTKSLVVSFMEKHIGKHIVEKRVLVIALHNHLKLSKDYLRNCLIELKHDGTISVRFFREYGQCVSLVGLTKYRTPKFKTISDWEFRRWWYKYGMPEQLKIKKELKL